MRPNLKVKSSLTEGFSNSNAKRYSIRRNPLAPIQQFIPHIDLSSQSKKIDRVISMGRNSPRRPSETNSQRNSARQNTIIEVEADKESLAGIPIQELEKELKKMKRQVLSKLESNHEKLARASHLLQVLCHRGSEADSDSEDSGWQIKERGVEKGVNKNKEKDCLKASYFRQSSMS